MLRETGGQRVFMAASNNSLLFSRLKGPPSQQLLRQLLQQGRRTYKCWWMR
ncbi:rCG59785, isoform CRA_b [Rattus norvegicus]|uniref:RCG59785, isoform CRA_b n=1 Tax=Rattus norvegicus TaxID=10116 RepID=A6HQV0_RAT|nr:rCG59785, isoform CRA_b [Rattus norvegicus]